MQKERDPRNVVEILDSVRGLTHEAARLRESTERLRKICSKFSTQLEVCLANAETCAIGTEQELRKLSDSLVLALDLTNQD